jgi:hypothetical protein
MSSKELVRKSPEFSFEDQVETFKRTVRLHIIYNEHATEENALETASHIPYGSVVFKEGYGEEMDYNPDSSQPAISVKLAYLAFFDPEAFEEHCSRVLEEIHSRTDVTPNFYPHYTLPLELHLARKQCFVATADAFSVNSYKKRGIWFPAEFQEYDDETTIDPERFLTKPTFEIARLKSAADAKWTYHMFRDIEAIKRLIIQTNIYRRLYTSSDANDLLTVNPFVSTDDGRIDVYLIRGAYHSRNITSLLEELGIVPEDITFTESTKKYEHVITKHYAKVEHLMISLRTVFRVYTQLLDQIYVLEPEDIKLFDDTSIKLKEDFSDEDIPYFKTWVVEVCRLTAELFHAVAQWNNIPEEVDDSDERLRCETLADQLFVFLNSYKKYYLAD